MFEVPKEHKPKDPEHIDYFYTGKCNQCNSDKLRISINNPKEVLCLKCGFINKYK